MPVAIISYEKRAGRSLLDRERAAPNTVAEREVIRKIVGARFREGEADVIKVAPELDREKAAGERCGQGRVANHQRRVGAAEVATEGDTSADAAAREVGRSDGTATDHQLTRVRAVFAA